MNIYDIIGWCGVVLGVGINIPQFILSLRTKSTKGLSKLTFIILFLAISCYLTRAFYIQDIIFITTNIANLIVVSGILIMMRVYK